MLATHHGVFISDRNQPESLDFMLQKPSLQELENLSKTHLFLMDIGIWLLSDRAVDLLMKRSLKEMGLGVLTLNTMTCMLTLAYPLEIIHVLLMMS